MARGSVFHRKGRSRFRQSCSQGRIQWIKRQGVCCFAIDGHTGVVMRNHAANETGNRRKQLLQVASRYQGVIDFQQHVQAFLSPATRLPAPGCFPPLPRLILRLAVEAANLSRCMRWLENSPAPTLPSAYAVVSGSQQHDLRPFSRRIFSTEENGILRPGRRQSEAVGFARPIRPAIPLPQPQIGRARSRRRATDAASYSCWDRKEKSWPLPRPLLVASAQPWQRTIQGDYDGGPPGPPSPAELRNVEDLHSTRNC